MQKVLYWVLASIAAVIVVGFALPRTHQVEVSTEIDAQPATVFALVNDFRRFSLWAPWADTDPNARFIYSGSSRGAGASMTWDGAIIGSGTQAITESRPFEYVGIRMHPGETGEASSWFRLEPGVGTTIVHWGFEVDHGINIVGRYFASMLGSVVARDYQAGLAGLKELAESLPRADFSDIEIEHLVVEPVEIAFLPTVSRPEPAAISDAMGKAYFEILTFIDKHGLQDAGAPMSSWGRPTVDRLSGSGTWARIGISAQPTGRLRRTWPHWGSSAMVRPGNPMSAIRATRRKPSY